MQQRAGSWCGKYSVAGPTKQKLGRIGYKRLRCRSLRCPRCRESKARDARKRIAEIASERQLTRFVTLTLDPSRIPQGTPSEVYLHDCWRKMRVYLARRSGESVDFIAILEFHRSGIAHLHLLVGIFIPQRWLSEAWQAVGGGKLVYIRYVDVHRVAAYLTRYLAGEKIEHTLSHLPRRGRIFGTSRSISFGGKKQKCGWWMVRKSIEYLRDRAQAVENERFERIDAVTCIVEQLVYFEAYLMSEATDDVDAFRVLRSIVRSQVS